MNYPPSAIVADSHDVVASPAEYAANAAARERAYVVTSGEDDYWYEDDVDAYRPIAALDVSSSETLVRHYFSVNMDAFFRKYEVTGPGGFMEHPVCVIAYGTRSPLATDGVYRTLQAADAPSEYLWQCVESMPMRRRFCFLDGARDASPTLILLKATSYGTVDGLIEILVDARGVPLRSPVMCSNGATPPRWPLRHPTQPIRLAMERRAKVAADDRALRTTFFFAHDARRADAADVLVHLGRFPQPSEAARAVLRSLQLAMHDPRREYESRGAVYIPDGTEVIAATHTYVDAEFNEALALHAALRMPVTAPDESEAVSSRRCGVQ
ncbi:hypothetical protein JKP88DRAFT_246734 [Tribonema minus]|uniref:Uncharacterized protein n=1 Tax=Tribonema minus TaxID=303371 RepID=A0A835YTX3_9STRA|nr:hypothetical protein JKP88DRAFT_246734 [Tribonema minus]